MVKPVAKRFSEELSQAIYESNLLADFDDEEMDKALRRAWNTARKDIKPGKKFEWSHAFILHLHKRMLMQQPEIPYLERGFYRSRSKKNINLASFPEGTTFPDHSQVLQLMDNWIKELPSLSPRVAHIQFEKIHPFTEGNGRLGRLLLWLLEIQRGQKLTVIRYQDKSKYHNWFK